MVLPTSPVVSPLRQRMIEDMRMRKLDGKTQVAYIRAVRRFAGFLGRSPDTATAEDLRRFQLHMAEQGTSSMTINATITGLRFFFEVTLGRGELMTKMSAVREPHTVAGGAQPRGSRAADRRGCVTRSIGRRCRWPMAPGLRASEVVALKVSDVDSQRMTLRVEQGKGRKDRYAHALAGAARAPARLVARGPPARQDAARRVAVSRPGSDRSDHARGNSTARSTLAATAAQIDKRVSMHTLRHCSRRTCWSRRSISASSRCCSGTRSSRPPSLYTQVATEILREVVSPLEILPPP